MYKTDNKQSNKIPEILDTLPEPKTLKEHMAEDPELPRELIEGILRAKQKMLITGPARAEKSRLLKELAVCLAVGTEWLWFRCRKCRVLYIDMTYGKNRVYNHFRDAFKGHFINEEMADGLMLWSLDGYDLTLYRLAAVLLQQLSEQPADVIIIDPLWKLYVQEENEAAFCCELDRICEKSGAALIYSLDDPRGYSIGTRLTDIAADFGIIGIDANAFLHLRKVGNFRAEADSSWRMEGAFRDYPPMSPLHVWYRYPVHHLNTGSALSDTHRPG